MNAERLLQHFERISEAPDAIPRLRRFILDLAVRGKLVEQDPSDEPASELLKRIQAEKAKLVKKAKALPEVTDDEKPFDSPKGWEWVRIRQVTIDRGQTVPKTDFTYIDVTAIDKERGCIAAPQILSASEAPSRARKLVQQGDVIYSCVRPYLLNIAVVDSEIEPSPVASTAFAVMYGFGFVLPQYLWVTLRSPFMVECVETRMRGQAYPAINDSDFAVLPIPLAPLAEQHRIVAKVDELMALCDQLESAKTEREQSRDRLVAASLHRLNQPVDTAEANTPEAFRDHALFIFNHLPRLTTRLAHLHHFREAILELGVTGRLSTQLSSDGDTQTLLDQLRLARRKAKKRLDQSDGDSESLPPLPAGWTWASVDEVAAEDENSITDGPFGVNLKTEHYVQTPGFRVIRLQNIGRGKFREEHRSYISQERFERLEKHRAFGGDLVVAGLVDPLVRCCEVPANLGPAVVKADCYRFKVNSKVSARFALHYLNSPVAQRFASAHHHGMTLVRIGLGNFRLIPFPLPPLAEQYRIVAKVDELMALCDQLEAQLTTTKADSRRLLEAVLHEAMAPALEETA